MSTENQLATLIVNKTNKMEMTTVKTIAVFAIIFGCFAVLYPKIFHPMLLHLLGMAPSRKSADDISKNYVCYVVQ